MNSEHQYAIVVGVDGSSSSKAALRWAVWHAGLVGGSVTAVMVWDMPMIYNWEPPGDQDFAHRTAQELRSVIDETVGDAAVEVHKEVAQGHPARALLAAAEETSADAIVVGNRGHGGFTEALLGSVSQHIVHHARCPVVVVREPAKRTT
ncbi:universal stress protein [Saccharopolyspora sp. NPDC050389]|uniref:universal stress protein n=1 Tax=Saccharopolyspora sp. NPDC050389 TaxID=3155516 RepID=UPI0033DAB526